jgi:protein SCO1/2
MVLKENGEVARYLYGLELPADDLRLALLEASQNRSMTTGERILMFCFRYDQHESRYVLAAWNVMRAGGALTVFALGAILGTYWLMERRRSAAAAATTTPTGTTPVVRS